MQGTAAWRYCLPKERILDQNADITQSPAGRQDRLAPTLVAIGLLALAVRVFFVVLQSRTQIFDTPFLASDSRLYMELAANLAAGAGMRTEDGPTAFVGPVYPLFLALLVRAGTDPAGIGLVQSVLGAGTAVLAALVSRELAAAGGYARPVAGRAMWVTGVGVALYPHVVLWTGYVLTETLFLTLAAGCLYAALRTARQASVPAAITAGALASLASLTRSAFLACAITILGWLVWSARGRRYLLAGVFTLALAIPLGAWTTRNIVDLGHPILTATQGGGSMYQGNARASSGGSRGYLDSVDVPPLEVPPGVNEVERDDLHMRRAIADMLSDPVRMAARWPTKLWNMWRPAYEGASFRNGAISLSTYPPVLILGVVGAVALMRRSRVTALLAILIATWAVTHMIVVGLIRYRVPAELFLLMALPFGIEVVRRVSRSIRGRALRGGALS